MSRFFYSASAVAKDNNPNTEKKEYFDAIKKNKEYTQIVQNAKSALKTLVNKYLPIYEEELKTVEQTAAEADTEDDREKFLRRYLDSKLRTRDFDQLADEYKSYYTDTNAANEHDKTGFGQQQLSGGPDYILNTNKLPQNFVNGKKRDDAISKLNKKIKILKPISRDFNDNNVTDKFKSYDNYILDKVKVSSFTPTPEDINKKLEYHMNDLFKKDELVKVLLLRNYPGKPEDYVPSMSDRGGTRTPKPRSKKHKIQKRPTKRRRHQIKRSRRNKK